MKKKYKKYKKYEKGKKMLTKQHIQEGLAISYVMAVANRAGVVCDVKPQFDYKVDGTFSGIIQFPNGDYCNNGFKIDFQLKSSTNVEIKDSLVAYDLEMKNYRDLIRTDYGTPRILILLKLPKNEEEWLNLDQDRMILKNCAWWFSLRALENSENKETKRIFIPVENVFDVTAINNLMERVEGGEKL